MCLNLGGAEVEKWDEFTNIQVVKESNGVDLFFQGDHFFEKPPIWYWSASILTNVFGDHLWVYRLPSAISGSAIVIIIYQFLKSRTNKSSALIGAISFLLIPHNILINPGDYFSTHTFRSADLDGLQIMLIFLSFCLLQTNRKYWVISCILLGIGFLVKGPLVIIFLALNSIFYLKYKTLNKEKYLKFLVGISVFILIVLSWHTYMFLNYGLDFTNIYLNYHILERVNQGLEGHGHPMGYILKVFFDLRVNPFWPVLIIPFLSRKLISNSYVKYSLFAIIAILGAFTLVETKLAWYVLPVYHFICLVLGSVVYGLKFKKNTK